MLFLFVSRFGMTKDRSFWVVAQRADVGRARAAGHMEK